MWSLQIKEVIEIFFFKVTCTDRIVISTQVKSDISVIYFQLHQSFEEESKCMVGFTGVSVFSYLTNSAA